jgi:GDP-D-mannose dehydratase
MDINKKLAGLLGIEPNTCILDKCNYVEIIDKYKRDEELNYLRGCADKLFDKVNVSFEYDFTTMINEMVDFHLNNLKR